MIFDVLSGTTAGTLAAATVAVLLIALWTGLPLAARRTHHDDGATMSPRLGG
jgi:hypothetical protein